MTKQADPLAAPRRIAMVLAWLPITVISPAWLDANPTLIRARDIEEGNTIIVGNLGLPLGTPVKVEGYLALVDMPEMKGLGVYHFVVDTVDGTLLGRPKTFRFRAEDELWSLMPQTEHDLKKLLDGYVRGDGGMEFQITPDQAEVFLREYTKYRRKVTVYESARYVGRPDRLPPTTPISYVENYRCETFLVVVEPDQPAVRAILNLGVPTGK